MLCWIAALALVGSKSPDMVQHRNLAVYAIYEPLGSVDDGQYITLDEGLKNGMVMVSERGGGTPIIRQSNARISQRAIQSGGAEVNTLWLTNRSGKKLILLSGEMVRGGQQDRIIGKDTIIPSGKDPVDIGVFCVEHGRWSGSKEFVNAPAAAALVAPSVRNSAQIERSQQKVWDNVARMGGGAAKFSASSAYRDVAANRDIAAKVEDYVKTISAQFPEGKAVGVAVAMNGKMQWVDRFSSNAMFRKYWPRLLRSYAMEASNYPSGATAPSRDEAMRFTNARDGKMTYEGAENGSKLVRIESKGHVILQLQDTAANPPSKLHESIVAKG